MAYVHGSRALKSGANRARSTGQERSMSGLLGCPSQCLSWQSGHRRWSSRYGDQLRNVEAEGSSSFTSTKGPGQGPKVGVPRISSGLT